MSMLGFFRKRQKLIFIIMVVLMVSFLIGFQGFTMLFSKKPGKEIIGSTSSEKFSLNMLRRARSDLEIMRRLMPGFGQQSPQALAFRAMYTTVDSQDKVSLAYMLLLSEADRAGLGVTAGEIERAIGRMAGRGFDYDSLAGSLRQNQGLPEKELRGVLARWLIVFKNYQASNVIVPPSREQLLNLFRDLNEKMNLSVVKLPADAFLDKVAKAKPTEAQIKELFDKYKNRSAGQFSGFDSFGFGYIQQPRVQLAYLFVDQTAIERATTPSRENIQDYYNDNKSEFFDEPDKDGKVKAKNFSEVRGEIVKKLAPQAGQAKFQQIFEDVRRAVQQADSAGQKTPVGRKVFEDIVAKYTIPATELLNRKIPVVAIEQQPLEKAIGTLAELVSPRLTAICFPWGKFGKVSIDPAVKVSLIGRNLTVAEALEKIASQIPDMPKLQWACFAGIDGVIFPVGGIRLFPITAGQSGLETLEQLRKNKLLAGAASKEQRAWLLQIAMRAQAIDPAGKLKIGSAGPVATVWTEEGLAGKLLWILEDAQPAKSPEKITPDIKKNIVRDWKLTKAFERAEKQGETVKTTKQMQAVAKARKLTPIETGMFARRVHYGYGGGFFQLTHLPMLKFSDGVVDLYFIDKAFDALTPKDLGKAYGQESANAWALPLKCEKAVYIARRTDFLPATKDAFERKKAELVFPLQRNQYIMTIREWFTLANIVERTGFAEEHAGTFLSQKN